MPAKAEKITGRKLRRRIRAYVEACVNQSWKGGCHPDEWDEIDVDYEHATAVLDETIRQLFAERK